MSAIQAASGLSVHNATGGKDIAAGQIICMHDYGWYNWIGTEDGFSGVIDWDMAGPGVPQRP